LVGVQVLDGGGAGVFGAALSNILAGWIVVAAGYHAAFMSLGAVAGVGLALYLIAMPETGPNAAAWAEIVPARPPPNGGGAGGGSG
jgi:sugar phosphate permease